MIPIPFFIYFNIYGQIMLYKNKAILYSHC